MFVSANYDTKLMMGAFTTVVEEESLASVHLECIIVQY
jgi:hypothetical protein